MRDSDVAFTPPPHTHIHTHTCIHDTGDVGYLPHGYLGYPIGKSTNTTIAGADFRMLRITIASPTAKVIPHIVPPRAPSKVWIKLPSQSEASIQRFVGRRAGFKQLFDGIVLDWLYLSARSNAALETDAAWLRVQRLSVAVDISRAITMFPGLRLGNFTGSRMTAPWDCVACANGMFYNRSMATIIDVLKKSSLMGALDVVLTLHGEPELGPPAAEVHAMMVATLST